MALSMGTNASALDAASAVSISPKTFRERWFTGKRINSADAGAVALSLRLTVKISGTNQSIRNAFDAQGWMDTADSIL
tara:strand:- start:191 stop:424 length:234 start_codon:yes stop_codon:yes gene_type:complete